MDYCNARSKPQRSSKASISYRRNKYLAAADMLLLAGDDAGFITGSILAANGGQYMA
jgi:hypothetical protein